MSKDRMSMTGGDIAIVLMIEGENMRNKEILTCPYCGEEQYTHAPDDISGEMRDTECECCGKAFWYSVTVTRTYSSYGEDEDQE